MNRRTGVRRWLAATAAAVSTALFLGATPALADPPEPSPAERPLFDTGPARDAIRRLVGTRHGSQITLATIRASEGRDTFRITGRGARPVVEGSSTSALLMGFNWYLKHVVKADISWTGDQLDLPRVLPAPPEPIEKSSAVKHRFAGNDTEDGYSGPYRTFEDWERLIDVQALHGVNEIFMPIGTEAVYYEALQSFGYRADELRAWIPSPGYQPWWLLQNMSNFTAPVSADVIRARTDLGRRIADRMRSLGITPVLPGYFGTVPRDFEVKNPGATTVPQGTWVGLDRPDWLAPTDPLFSQVAARFYQVQERLLGKSSMFKMDLLHEGGRPGSISVGQASVAVQNALDKAHPGAIWAILGWQSNPRPETIAAIDRSRMLVVDGLSDRALSPDRETDWSGTPYAFGSIWNFGGNSTMGAPIRAWNERFWASLAKPGSALSGIAIMPEASYNNAVAMEFLAELPWHDGPVDLDQWFADYADARYGGTDPMARKAWQILAGTAYSIPPNGGRSSGHGGLFAAIPSLTVQRPHSWAQAAFAYDPAAFAGALPALLAVDESLRNNPAYRNDLLEVARQSVADRSRTLLPQIRSAYQAGDLQRFSQLTDTWLGYIAGVDDLVGTNEQYLIGSWLAKAKSWGANSAESAQLEYDARKQLTSWGLRTTDLQDYAYREWSGLLDGYYAPRWQQYFDGLKTALSTGTAAPAIDWYDVAERWSSDRSAYRTKPTGDTYAEAAKLLDRLRNDDYDLTLALRPTGTVDASGSARVTATVTNTNYFAALTGLAFDISAPAGTAVEPVGDAPSEIGPGGTVTRSWTVRGGDGLPSQVSLEVTMRSDQSELRKATAVLPVAADGRYQLSDLEFSSSRNHDGLYPVARDTVTPATPSGNGQPILLDGVAYSKGLGTNSNADVRFELGGDCRRFTTVVGIDDAMNHTADGDAVVRVFGDGRLLSETGVLRSGITGTGTKAAVVDADVTGVRQLRLQVHQYDANRYFDAVSFGVPTATCSAPPPISLSYGKPATATSTDGSHVPADALDGNLSTGWFCAPQQCAGQPSSLQVDLGAAHALSSVRVTPYYADGRSYLYRVDGSVDGQTWTRLAEKVTHKAQTDLGDRYDVSGEYRYVRVTGSGNTANAYTLHLQELAVYGVG
ncbi:alpha-N-acetylglucosaminidase TIM-barrel domain-containing protein [Kribbella soli]|uniref:Alpha-N-acetylglucosaminidase n=1 Tax=Kribbella soli TaxID=1124743 RepID=A0A4R0H5N6_9ACTN|nr:alpha-N-acetylglucosaminidase TIM-barrel domain-containing protein [Kribbella soli]TCC06145.1 alpha-N-acetylglucosaminidase [Kribbella soli]